MAAVIFLPGFGGSELSYTSVPSTRLWIDYAILAAGGLRRARLAADGVSPAPPNGFALTPGMPLTAYFADQERALQSQLAPLGHTLVPIGYDWRMSCDRIAHSLADKIAADVSPADPCTIIGYSLGGLVARRAWWYLSQAGIAGKVRRIITVGGPAYGSYQSVRLLADDLSTVTQLAILGSANPFADVLSIIGGGPAFMTTAEVVDIAATWPALYETLPALHSPDAAADAYRAAVYDRSRYQPIHPVQAWLDYAVLVWQPWLLSAAAVPPPAVLTCVIGTGIATPYRLRPGQTFFGASSWDYSSDGDGVVTADQAILPGAAVVRVQASHADVYGHLVDSGTLLALILDDRSPASSPPPPIDVPGIVLAGRQDPPLSPSVFDGQLVSAPGWSPGRDP